MGTSFFPVFDRKLGTDFVRGKSLAQTSDTLDLLAKRLRAKPLSTFFSMSFSAVASFIDDEDEAKAIFKKNPEEWFAASSGLRTVCALIRHLEKHPKAIACCEAVIDDLRSLQSALQLAKKAGARWHLAAD